MLTITKFDKKPDFIASHKRINEVWVEEEWYTKADAVPDWWNPETHVLVEQVKDNFVKMCQVCDDVIDDDGCVHNLAKK